MDSFLSFFLSFPMSLYSLYDRLYMYLLSISTSLATRMLSHTWPSVYI